MKGKINRGRHTDHPAEYHTMWTNQWTATRWGDFTVLIRYDYYIYMRPKADE